MSLKSKRNAKRAARAACVEAREQLRAEGLAAKRAEHETRETEATRRAGEAERLAAEEREIEAREDARLAAVQEQQERAAAFAARAANEKREAARTKREAALAGLTAEERAMLGDAEVVSDPAAIAAMFASLR